MVVVVVVVALVVVVLFGFVVVVTFVVVVLLGLVVVVALVVVVVVIVVVVVVTGTFTMNRDSFPLLSRSPQSKQSLFSQLQLFSVCRKACHLLSVSIHPAVCCLHPTGTAPVSNPQNF